MKSSATLVIDEAAGKWEKVVSSFASVMEMHNGLVYWSLCLNLKALLSDEYILCIECE